MPARKAEVLLEDTYVKLVRAHDRLGAGFQELFKRHGLTQSQYNVLRIARGTGAEGATCQHIGRELLTRVPDVTRLVDRMEKAGLVTRARGLEDRRVVRVHLTSKGRRLCDRLDGPVLDKHREQFAHVDRKTLEELNRALKRLLSVGGS